MPGKGLETWARTWLRMVPAAAPLGLADTCALIASSCMDMLYTCSRETGQEEGKEGPGGCDMWLYDTRGRRSLLAAQRLAGRLCSAYANTASSDDAGYAATVCACT